MKQIYRLSSNLETIIGNLKLHPNGIVYVHNLPADSLPATRRTI